MIRLLPLMLATLLCSCTKAPVALTRPAEAVRLTLAPVGTLARGQHARLSAIAIMSDGSRRDVTEAVRWSGSGAVAIAGPRGEVAAGEPGRGQVIAELGALRGSAPIEVTGAQLERLELEPATLDLPRGLVSQVRTIGIYADGARVDLTAQTRLTSTDETVLAVLGNGTVRAQGGGRASLTARLARFTASAPAAVRGVQLVSIAIAPASLRLEAGAQARVRAIAAFSDGSEADITHQAIWSSPAPDTADFARVGVVNARSAGEVRLQAQLGEASAELALAVGPGPAMIALNLAP